MFLVLPYIDPKRKNYEHFESSYQFVKYLVIIFLLGVEVMTLLIATGIIVNKPISIQVMVSLLFILIGNVMGRFKHNYFVGIKTPWTLANEEVWRKTHRMAAPIWVIGGIVNIILAFTAIKYNQIGFMVIVAIITIVPIAYSYFAYQKIVVR
ncbi:MAG TPA: SdpI family protein [Desulfosporosinus sp.]|nr:SdpI family protein [Desulfosporosinus sp.]